MQNTEFSKPKRDLTFLYNIQKCVEVSQSFNRLTCAVNQITVTFPVRKIPLT